MIHKVLRQIAVQQIDAAFVVSLLTGHVVGADLIVDRTTRATYGCRHVIAHFDIPTVGPNLFDDSKRLMPQNEIVVARGWIAVKCIVDFAVRCVDADLENLDQNSFSVRDLTDRRHGNIAFMYAIGCARPDCNRFHNVLLLVY